MPSTFRCFLRKAGASRLDLHLVALLLVAALGSTRLRSDFSCARFPVVKSYISRVVARAPDCETDPTALQVRCCGDWPCGGTADRIRGISGLLVAATAANRTLSQGEARCFTRSWLAPGPHVKCPGRRVWIGPSKENDRGRIAVNGRGTKLTIRSPELLRKASFVGSSHPAGIPEIGVPRTFYDVIMAERNFAGAKKIGFVALALSGVIDAPFVQARSAVLAAVALSSGDGALLTEPDFVALHVRCGGSVFTNSNGQVLKCLDMNDGMTTSIPDLILAVARDLPRETDCVRQLFVGSDSDRFIAELKLALPKRMPVVTSDQQQAAALRVFILMTGGAPLTRGASSILSTWPPSESLALMTKAK